MIYEPAASRRYEKLPVSQKERTTLVFVFFPPIFIACHYVIFPHFYIVIRNIGMSLYFDKMNVFPTINTNYGGNQNSQ